MFDGLALGTMGGTYGAAPLACATANATLDVIMEENLLENSTQRGRQLVEVCLSLLVRRVALGQHPAWPLARGGRFVKFSKDLVASPSVLVA